MEDLSLHLLDIMENCVEARAHRIEVRIIEDPETDLLTMEIRDDGKGMDAQTLKNAADPFFTTRKTRRVGLGLSMFCESARATGGDTTIESRPGKGTRVKATFRRGHIDMKPLGDIPQTLLTLIAGHPEIDLRYDHRIGRDSFCFDTIEIHEGLGSVRVLQWIEVRLRSGLADLARRAKSSSSPASPSREYGDVPSLSRRPGGKPRK
jgi:hypothetical protein